ncbi:BnaA02g10730D [Brassica napus]|uniref:(rape) hypothetical protein n=1 Tax=Brassica napus TaxID=3708 RepID=A0A078GR17_BRANA|nr:unnamed protein product [Brassica napus]CDY27053.1 BnaA02g10730D [Brassica napus]
MVNLFPISMMVFDNEDQVMCSSTMRLEKASIINLIFDVYDDVNHAYDDGVDEDPTSDILDEENDASFIGIQEMDVITLNQLTMFRRLANLTLKLVLQIRVEKSLASHEIWVTPTICSFKMISSSLRGPKFCDLQ